MKANQRVCLYENSASQRSIIEIILLVGLLECARDLTKCAVWDPEDIYFFLSILMVRGEAASTRREVPRRKSFQYQPVYFILGILRTELWSPGAKCVVCKIKNKKITWSPQKLSRISFNIPRGTIKFHLPT